jgi:putative serine protease PepD
MSVRQGGAAPAGRARSPRLVPALIGVAVALAGGVAGGLIVWAIVGNGNGGGGSTVAGAGSGGCQAANVADAALPSVVTIQAGNGQGASTGSGVVVRKSGYVLTNNHVISVAAGGGTVKIMRGDGETTAAKIVGRDPFSDLAVIKAENAADLPPIAVGESSALRVGQPVVALGSPLGLASTVTAGIVSALDRYVRVPAENGRSAHLIDAIQTDASINPGNSGGALVDCQARLVGINTAAATVPNSGGGSIGLGFAIPVDLAVRIADELITSGKVTRPSFGMQVQEIPQDVAQQTGGSGGLFVQAVTPGGPAAKAGLHAGDVILEVDGNQAADTDALIVKTLTLNAGDKVRLTYERQGSTHTTSLTLSPGTAAAAG